MSLHTRMLFGITALAALAACSSDDAPSPTAITAPTTSSLSASSTGQEMRYLNARVCPGRVVGTARCHAWVRVDPSGKPVRTTTPRGFGPLDLRSAYKLTSTGSSTQTIAIVDAFDAPTAEADLAVYRSYFNLPACTTANGCFRKINQNGGATPPSANASWAQEISLDLDMASAICPNCKILLVEANSNSLADLYTAVDRAAQSGATVISNSYGGPEYSGEVNDESHYNHGVPITVSSGDAGYGVEFPASSQYVIAVGGTSLTKASGGRGWAETAWAGAGSGCSAYITKRTWQTDACGKRTVADVSAIADPNTGVAVYDSYAYRGASGWLVFGGTSVAAPVIAGVYALGGGGTGTAQSLYGNTAALFDVTSGSNGSCGGSYLCTAGAGYDGPTGLGTPNGFSAF
jgi:subtilase family serine protease